MYSIAIESDSSQFNVADDVLMTFNYSNIYLQRARKHVGA